MHTGLFCAVWSEIILFPRHTLTNNRSHTFVPPAKAVSGLHISSTAFFHYVFFRTCCLLLFPSSSGRLWQNRKIAKIWPHPAHISLLQFFCPVHCCTAAFASDHSLYQRKPRRMCGVKVWGLTPLCECHAVELAVLHTCIPTSTINNMGHST